ncbi:MAG: hypothetical protein JW750_06690 [Anaerolineaceae bacterium]|nr:hypothetical protein [Anaerolineaceae bacterium]
MSERMNADERIAAAQLTEPSLPSNGNQKQTVFIVIGAVIFVGLLIAGAVLLLTAKPEVAGQWRDVFIIFIAVQMLLIGLAIVIVMIQMAIMINLLQNELRPIIQSTNETANTLRGTAEFLSKNLTEPVIKLNGYLAGMKKFMDVFKKPGA